MSEASKRNNDLSETAAMELEVQAKYIIDNLQQTLFPQFYTDPKEGRHSVHEDAIHHHHHHDIPIKLQIEWITPASPSFQKVYMLEKMPFRISLIVNTDLRKVYPEDIAVQLWTNLYHKGHNEGDWHGVDMTYLGVRNEKDGNKVIFLYGLDLLLTCLGTYSFTYRARPRGEPADATVWAATFMADGQVNVVQSVRDATIWVQDVEFSQITKNIYLGNYQAAQIANDLKFDCMLNMADDAPIYPLQMLRPVVYRRCPLPAGADHVIPDRVVCQSVNWLRGMSQRCDKVLVHSKAGYGRAGSIVIAYIYAYNKNLNFDETVKFVEARHFVYNHKGLRATLHRLYPRE